MRLETKRILVVEDDGVLLERLALSLKRRGYEVRSAASMDEVSDVLSDGFAPDGAVVDLRLGQESGLEVARMLRGRIAGVRILILTGYGSIATAVDAMKLGAVDYLSKPADAEQIEAALFPDVGAEERMEGEDYAIPSLDRVEWEHLQRVLRDCEGNISETARRLGIERRTLQRKLQKYPPTR